MPTIVFSLTTTQHVNRASEMLAQFYMRPETNRRWKASHNVAFVVPNNASHYLHNRSVVEAVQQICCGFCRLPATLLGDAWEEMKPSWLRRPAHHTSNLY